MKLKDNINLAASFERLKKSLQLAQKELTKESEFPAENYARAYGVLSGSVQGFLVTTTDINYKELVNDAPPMGNDPETSDDIPTALFTQKETSDDPKGPL